MHTLIFSLWWWWWEVGEGELVGGEGRGDGGRGGSFKGKARYIIIHLGTRETKCLLPIANEPLTKSTKKIHVCRKAKH